MIKVDKLKIASLLFVFGVLLLSSCERPEPEVLVKFGMIENNYAPLEDRTETSAILSATISRIDSGVVVISKGICWSTEINPTVKDKKKQFEEGGLGKFYVDATGLKAGTTYFFRSYMISSFGIQYSKVTNFYTYAPL